MSNRLTLRALPNDSFLSHLEKESIALFHSVKAAIIPGPWEPSPVEEKYKLLREALLQTPGVLSCFRRSFLAAGRLNFPDIPRPKDFYLEWGNRLPKGQRCAGALHLLKQAIRLYCYRPFQLEDLDDNLIGQPSTFPIPKSAKGVSQIIGWRFRRSSDLRKSDCYHITEAQIRFLYYRMQISVAVNRPPESILEIGGGYGGLAAELLQHFSVRQYFIVELADAVPLTYFYLWACFDCSIQVLYRPDDRIDPTARIVILAPWKLPDLSGDIDLLINTMSFQHMSRENLDFYFAEVDRLRVKWMYLVNRNTQRDPTDVIISQYPIPRCYRVLYKKPWLFGPHLEILYKRDGEVNSA